VTPVRARGGKVQVQYTLCLKNWTRKLGDNSVKS